MKKLGTWLGIAAIALQMGLPLAAAAAPAELVPICSTGGTHELQVPANEIPRQGSLSHRCCHCALCFAGAALPPHRPALAIAGGAEAALASGSSPVLSSLERRSADARAPPLHSLSFC